MNLWISPHNDDSVLFGAFTLMREHPLVLTVTDAWKQYNRGANITAEQRKQEDIEAMKLLSCSIVFGGIRDDVIDEWAVKNLLTKFYGFDKVYIPAVQGGNPDHDLIGKIAKEIFSDKCVEYMTYTHTELYTKGNKEIVPTPEELTLKERALACYISQQNYPSTAPHFLAVKGKSEWYI